MKERKSSCKFTILKTRRNKRQKNEDLFFLNLLNSANYDDKNRKRVNDA